LVNRNAVSIHHVANSARFCPVAFIFCECRTRMVNRWCVGGPYTHQKNFRRELHVKSSLLKT
jgi:hypothetical protein